MILCSVPRLKQRKPEKWSQDEGSQKDVTKCGRSHLPSWKGRVWERMFTRGQQCGWEL